MKFKTYSQQYRENLDSLCKLYGFNNIFLFDMAKPFIPSTLKVVGPSDSTSKQINCHGYTFNKNCWYEVKNVFKILKDGKLIETKKPQEGDIVIYYLRDTEPLPVIKHTGIYQGKGKIKSKWSNGPIFLHDIWNVPYTYGKIVKFFKKLDSA